MKPVVECPKCHQKFTIEMKDEDIIMFLCNRLKVEKMGGSQNTL